MHTCQHVEGDPSKGTKIEHACIDCTLGVTFRNSHVSVVRNEYKDTVVRFSDSGPRENGKYTRAGSELVKHTVNNFSKLINNVTKMKFGSNADSELCAAFVSAVK